MSEPNALSIVLGGEELLVHLYQATAPEKILVRYLPIRRMPDLEAAQDDDCKLVELYTGKDEAWCDQLSAASFDAILKKGAELNFPIRDRWQERRVESADRNLKQLQNLIGKVPEEMRGPMVEMMQKLERQILVMSSLPSWSAESAKPSASPTSATATPSSSTSG